jgi:protein-S-isoprenylcysteine O-methyltransferase Ste14
MVAWLNVGCLVLVTALTLLFYVMSAGPAALEQKIGPAAYARCGRYRAVAMVFMFVGMANYLLYYFYPLPIPLPEVFPWPWWVSAVAGTLIALPSGYLLGRGMRDAGKEALVPQKEQELYGGIYQRVRHPQAWEALLWFTVALWLHSPFLVLYSFVWLGVEYAMVMAEERDLVLRFGQPYVDYRRRTPAFWPRGREVGS